MWQYKIQIFLDKDKHYMELGANSLTSKDKTRCRDIDNCTSAVSEKYKFTCSIRQIFFSHHTAPKKHYILFIYLFIYLFLIQYFG